MKKTIILSAAMALATFGANAQDANATPATQQTQHVGATGTPEERAKNQLDNINKDLHLSPEQYNKVLELTKNSMTQKDAIRASATQGDDMKAKMKAVRDQEEAQLKTILTPEQFTKLQEIKKSHETNHRPQ